MRLKIKCLSSVWLLIAAMAILSACREAEPGPVRILKDGLEIVENGNGIYPEKGEPRTLSLREEFRIDLEDGSFAEAGLTDVETLDVDSHGRIYLFRRQAISGNIVFKFDERGRLLGSFCAIGQGPGEVQSPRFMRMTSVDEIPVINMGNRAVVFFDTEGKVSRKTALPAVFFPLPRGIIPLANGDYLVSYFRVKPETLEFSEFGVGVFSPDFAKRLDLRVYPVPDENDLRTPFYDFPLVAASDEAIFVASMAPKRDIEVYDFGGRLTRKILADYPIVNVPPEFPEEFLSPIPQDHPFWKNLEFPSTFPPFKSLFADDLGRLYAAGYAKDPGTGANVCDVFSPSGVRILRTAMGYQTLQHLHPLDAVLKNGRLYCVREKPGGFLEVLVFSLQWTVD